MTLLDNDQLIMAVGQKLDGRRTEAGRTSYRSWTDVGYQLIMGVGQKLDGRRTEAGRTSDTN